MLKLASKDTTDVSKHNDFSSVVFPTEESHVRETSFKYCREFLHGSWRVIQLSEMVIRKVSGGLSNLLYYCELPEHVREIEDEPRQVLVRFYGQVNRDRALETLITECVILTLLSERQRGPRLYGVFPGGRIEEYVTARPLLTKELAHPTISVKIAEKLATIHLMNVPMNKSPTRIWEQMGRWVETIERLVDQEPPELTDSGIADKLRALDIGNEYLWLRTFLKTVSSPVVFCHNDMQEGNILLRNGDGELELENVTGDDLVVIDFEYCCYNWRGFDLANHFVEWMYDYTNDSHPYYFERPVEEHASAEQKERFVNTYLTALTESPRYRERSEDTTENVLQEIEYYTLASHFFWALWSVVSNSNMFTGSVQFDYWCYGESRFEAYFKQKKILTSSPH